jgi:hypothetical protein
VARYEREQPVFRSKLIAKDRGDALLVLLDGGGAVDRWPKNGNPPGENLEPIPSRLWMTLALTNGATYRIGLSHAGLILYLPEGFYEPSEASSNQVAQWMAETEADLRREVISAPKPCTYKVGTVDDGGTLSGIARLFYGDASNWKQIYEANRPVLKNPNIISGTETLTIPKL